MPYVYTQSHACTQPHIDTDTHIRKASYWKALAPGPSAHWEAVFFFHQRPTLAALRGCRLRPSPVPQARCPCVAALGELCVLCAAVVLFYLVRLDRLSRSVARRLLLNQRLWIAPAWWCVRLRVIYGYLLCSRLRCTVAWGLLFN